MFIGDCVYSFESLDEIFKFPTNIGFKRVQFPAAYSKSKIFYLVDKYQFIPYNTNIDRDEYQKISEMDLSHNPYKLLYNTNDGEWIKIFELTLIAPSHEYENFENYFDHVNIEEDVNDGYEDEDENNEISFYNGNNELVKIFNEEKNVWFV